MAVADRAHARDELLRRDDEATFALHGLEHDRGDVLRCDLRDERALERCERGLARDAAVLVRERDAVHLGRERAETRLVRVRLRGEREREQRPPVEAALEADHRGPPGVRARELDGVLDRFGARVEERRLRRPVERRDGEQALGEGHADLVRDHREVGVEKARRLVLHGLDDLRMRVADVETADAAGEVDVRVAVDVGHRRPSPLGGDDRQIERHRLGDDTLLPLDDRAGAGPRHLGAQSDCPRRGHSATIPAAPNAPRAVARAAAAWAAEARSAAPGACRPRPRSTA